MPDSRINLYDRVKELTYTEGTNDFTLSGPPNGFSSFSSIYTSGDRLFYAVTDGVDYEVGSGTYHTGIVRHPLRSSNSDNKVSFSAGIKEIYSTYPATHAILSGSGLDDLNVAQDSGVAIWGSAHTLDYNSNFIWDRSNNRLGINTSTPQYAIDVGGSEFESSIRSSGIIVGTSGVLFPSGSQTDPFNKNLLGDSNIEAVIELSGVVNQYFWLKQQNEGTVFAGPPSGCGDCTDYPNFRALAKDDYPFLDQASGILNNKINVVSGICDPDVMHMTLKAEADYPSHGEGLVWYDADLHSLVVYNDESSIRQHIGRDLLMRVRNNTGFTISKGNAVRIIGSHNNEAPEIDEAIGSGEFLSNVIGLTAHDISHNSFGYVNTDGVIRNLDTSNFNTADELFLSPSTSGALVTSSGNAMPSLPDYRVPIGFVIRSHSSNGSILVQLGKHKIAGPDVKGFNLEPNLSGVPFVASIADSGAVGIDTNFSFVFDNTSDTLNTQNLNSSGTIQGVEILGSGGLPAINTFNVTNNGSSAYRFNGMGFQNVDDPALKLYRGMTYDFNLNVGTHTFFITTEPKAGDYEGVSGVALTEDSGVYNNGIGNGILRFTVPQNAPSVLWYNCQNHAAMSGQIQVQTIPYNKTPATSSYTPGNSGDLVFDSNYIYAFVPSGSAPSGYMWKRAALTVW
jgi:hypothetical protein